MTEASGASLDVDVLVGELVALGASLSEIREVMGHENIATTTLYTQVLTAAAATERSGALLRRPRGRNGGRTTDRESR